MILKKVAVPTGILNASLGCLFLFAWNAYIVREIFSVEFTRQLQSNEGAFIALSRFFGDNGPTVGWFPWWNGGMPVPNAYPPLLPWLVAGLSALTHWTSAHAFHVVTGAVYCMAPVAIFLLAYFGSGRLGPSVLAGAAYSVLSPSALLIPAVWHHNGGPWASVRLTNIVYFGEIPHAAALAMVPLALLCIFRALERRTFRDLAASVTLSGLIVLTNTIGATTLALGALCILLARGRVRDVPILAAIGLASYCAISPWMPPSLLVTLWQNSWTAGGDYRNHGHLWLAVAALSGAIAVAWRATQSRVTVFERFLVLFAVAACSIPACDYLFRVALLPQPRRYGLEFEVACCLLLAFALWHLPRWPCRLTVGIVTCGLVAETIVCRHQASDLLRPIAIRTTPEYRVAEFFDRHLHGERVMISGDAAYWANIFFDIPQFSGGHEPSAPNWMQRVAVYTIYSGMNAGSEDAAISVFWLKAYGNRAIYVPGPRSRENYHPFANPAKFEGVLPVLWREGDDTIYGVPGPRNSLAHVIANAAIVRQIPVHGLDREPARRYVAALDSEAASGAQWRWKGSDSGVLEATFGPGEVVSLQIPYDPGWRAHIGASHVPITRDGLGLMIITPDRLGECSIEITYGLTAEGWVCRLLSLSTVIGLVLLARRGGQATSRLMPPAATVFPKQTSQLPHAGSDSSPK